MKSITFIALFLAVSVAHAQRVAFSPKSSELVWEGSKVVGSNHKGTIKIKSGHISLEKQSPKSLKVIVDMTSIKNTDLTDPAWNKKLVDHLKSNDFFASAKHPESKIEINSVKKEKDGRYKLKGKLTIKGITKPIELHSKLEQKKGTASALVADFEFDRTDFDVRYGSGKFFKNLGDKMISDKVKVSVKLKLEKPTKLSKRK